jgi:hypothetical protein
MFGGDMTDTGTNTQWGEWFDDWQLTIASDGRMFPVIATRGNHESSNAMIENLFDVPSPDVYYALTLGGSLVRAYTLNTEISISGSQTTWLSNDLASNSNVTWKIAQYHKPMRPHQSGKAEGNNQYTYWAGLFQQHGVKLIVESDAHTVKSTWPVVPSSASGNDMGFIRDDANGSVYVGEGCWGAPLRSNDDDKSWTRNSGMFNHFNWIFIDQNTIEVRTVNVDNADNVSSVSDANIFQTPSNLNVWTPSNGSLISITKTSTPPTNPSNGTISKRIATGNDDVEESQTGAMYMNSSDIELVNDGATYGNQKIGLRFTGLNIPQGATIVNAYIQFACDETGSTATSLNIKGEDVNNSAAFTTAANNVSSRAQTAASVNWSPAAWSTVGQATTTQRTPDIKSIVQAIVNRSGWASGNALSIIITGTGKRTAEAYEGSTSLAPQLVVEYSTAGTTPPPPSSGTLSKHIATGNDDVEESQSGAMYMNSSDIELVNDGATYGNQKIGLRFTGITVPQGATISNAYIQFTCDETGSTATSLTIKGENVNNSAAFTTASGNVSSRAQTAASVAWSPSAWSTVGQSTTTQRTPDIKTIIQAIVNRSGWVSGNALSIIITGTGKRTAEAYEGSATQAPLLVIEYSNGSSARFAQQETDLAQEEESVPENANAGNTAPDSEKALPEMQIYPNPFSDMVVCELFNMEIRKTVNVLILDTQGKTVLKTSAETDNGKIEISTADLPSGTYYLKVENAQHHLFKKIVKR